MVSHPNLDWLDDQGEQSPPPWCHFSCPIREVGEGVQCCFWYHRSLQQTPLSFQSVRTEQPSSLFVSRNCSIQRAANSIGTLGEENSFENREDSVTEANPIGVTLNPARVSPRLHFVDCSTDHMLTDGDLSGTGRQFSNFDTSSGIQVDPDDSSTPYTLECFERYFPFEQVPTLLPSYNAPSTFEDEHLTDNNDHSRRLDSELATPESSLKMLTETKQADLESVFNSTTGEQHKLPTKKERRKSTLRESLHRRLIRGLGGQCKSCKRRKRRVSRRRMSMSFEF